MRPDLTLSGAGFSQGSHLSPEWITQLAANGAICESCGGIHMVSIDQLIVAMAVQRNVGIRLPWCNCTRCPTCLSDPGLEALVKELLQMRQAKQRREGTQGEAIEGATKC